MTATPELVKRYKALVAEYNAAVANGQRLEARRIDIQLRAIEKASQ